MTEYESLVVSRSRRANAGSRLKRLIELEEQAGGNQDATGANGASGGTNEEDENVNLLFAEDGEDEEFVEESESGMSGGEEEGEEEEEEEDGGKNGDDDERTRRRDVGSESEEQEVGVDSDEVLSDSELSVSDSDESDGERELERQERLQKRRSRKRTIVPAIKQRATSLAQNQDQNQDLAQSLKKRKKRAELSEALLGPRRSSSRATVVENKKALVKRLKRNEEKKASMKPIVRQKHEELSQEERLKEAIETEKANVLSLNQFMEQEIVKKETQRQMLLLRRKHLKNVVRLVSEEKFITPMEEIKEARRLFEIKRAKKKLGRKRKNPIPEKIVVPGSIDTDLPLVKLEMEKNGQAALFTAAEESGNSQDSMQLKPNGDNTTTAIENPEFDHQNGDSKDVPSTKIESSSELDGKVDDDANHENSLVNDKEEDHYNEKTLKNLSSAIDNGNEAGSGKDTPEKDSVQTRDSDNVETVSVPSLNTTKENDSVEGEGIGNALSKSKETTIQPEGQDDSITPETDADSLKKEGKRVKFADETHEESDDSAVKPETPVVDGIESEVFAGPYQRIARNTILLIDFEEDKDPNLKLDLPNIKRMLFGEQALYPASRRFKDLKAYLRIGGVENPYAAAKEEKDELFEPVESLTEDDEMFEQLKKLPRLGVAQEEEEEEEEENAEENAPIIIKTEAPTGLYLPNGSKKVCLISGTEVRYFDPSTGIPYSSVEVYRFLKTIEQGNIPWHSIPAEANDFGAVELYLGSRDGSVRHAKGVPEGFSG